MRRLMILLGLVALSFAWSTPAVKGEDSEERVGSFTFTKFSAPFPGTVNTESNGIDNSGQVVGEYANGQDNVIRGYLRGPDGSFTMIDVPFTGAFNTFPRDINDDTIIGNYHGALPPPGARGRHAFVSKAGVFTTIDVPFPDTFDTRCRGINDPGQIVGAYRTQDFHLHGFLLSGGSFSPIDFPGATQTLPRRINNRGQIVGAYLDANGLTHGFLLDGGTFITLDVTGVIESEADDINNNGQIVGTYVDTDNHVRGFLFAGGILTTVALPGVPQNTDGSTLFNLNFFGGIFGINDAGVITGVFLGRDGNFHGFIGVPED